MLNSKLLLLAAAGLALPSAALADHHGMKPKNTIVQTAAANPDFETLVAAVKAAGLVDTLSGKGPFTVFAPTDAAFGKLPAGTVDTLVKPENKGTLTSILTYHVVPGRLSSGEIQSLIARHGGTATLTTVQGGTLKVAKHGNGFMITDAKNGTSMITAANVGTSNGVIHVIDTVLMP